MTRGGWVVDGWAYGCYAAVVAPIKLPWAVTTTDPLPEVGEIGEVVTINTTNGKVTSLGVAFPLLGRSWVIPVEFLEHD
jgi:hypothetical protein